MNIVSSLPFFVNRNRVNLIVFCVFLIVLGIGYDVSNTDFLKGYYRAGASVINGERLPYEGVVGFVNLPLFSLLFAPFALLSKYQAGLLFFLSELAAYAVAYLLFLEKWGKTGPTRWYITFIFIFNKPFLVGLTLGQTSVWVLCLLALCVRFYDEGMKIGTGLILAGMFIIKVPLGLLFFFFLLKKEYKIVLASMVGFSGFLLLSILIFGIDEHLRYLSEIWLHNTNGIITGRYNQNIFASISRFTYQQMHNYIPQSLSGASMAVAYLISLATLASIVLVFRRNNACHISHRNLIEISIALSFVVWFTPLSWEHYYIYSLLPLLAAFLLIEGGTDREPIGIATSFAAFILINLPYKTVHAIVADYVGESVRFLYPLIISAPSIGAMLLTALLLYLFQTGCQPQLSKTN